MLNQSALDELKELDKRHFIHPTSDMKQLQEHGSALFITEAEGIYLKDAEGNSIIDGLSSLWNVNIGHGRTEMGEAAKKQMNKLAFTSTFNNWSHEPAIRLAAEISEWTPENLNATFFTSGGSEANDSAFKTVRHYWKIKGRPEKKKIISRKLSYHGLAMGATSATAIEEFNSFSTSNSPDFHYVDSSIENLKTLIDSEGAGTIAAFVSEPVQGSGGVNLPPDGYFEEVRKVCDENDILFISDEVICGFGRTGTNFGFQHFNFRPDIITFAKGISSGYAPLGGMVVLDDIHQTLIEKTEGTFWHGYTYSGHPTAAAVALKNLEIIKDENMIEHVQKMGEIMLSGFESIKKQHEQVSDVRSIGLLGAIEFKKSFNLSTVIGKRVMDEALKRGLFCRYVKYGGQDTIAFAPPFCITEEQMEDLLRITNEAIHSVKAHI